jgi:hypothetical protein
MNIGSPIEVRVKSLLLYPEKGAAVILMEGPGGAWGLPILAKASEVTSIALILEGQEPPRPLSHDLMARIIEKLKARTLQVLIDILEEPVCHGIIALDVQGREMDFDSRPSDAIALALRAKVPIFVSPAIVAKGAIYFNREDWSLNLVEKVKLEN